VSKSKECRSWVVYTKSTILKAVFCEDCTEAEARQRPYHHAVGEQEIEQYDYEVQSVSPSK